MRFEAQVTVHVPRQILWDFLWDVPRLTACVPGCEAVQEIERVAHHLLRQCQCLEALLVQKMRAVSVRVQVRGWNRHQVRIAKLIACLETLFAALTARAPRWIE